ncbi:hypothetical protein MK489_16635 [Myxococcota bacterium]|nr:hypothetical protein [Myxococcota bacterium]
MGGVIQIASSTTASGRGRASKRTARADQEASNDYDFARLEQSIENLVEALREAREDNVRLSAQVESNVRQIAELDARIRTENQKRQDVVKRLDDLIAQIEVLEREQEQPKLTEDRGD